ncbi:Restriction endonuclease FokI, C terminal [Clostridium sp. USBA 49]|uniref:Restriction endonuclease, type II, AlwI n=2 Tax=Eubacteriales TaxID=186802 RepID=A3DG90_ACET2|nr:MULTISPECIES: restriction endonuclease FokI C-terminal domain-containing protein [Eubacteriales]ABN52969.1 Restriction endonuclease, type II, AlwI [Acetivibrio thermocellus ATCC 27405]EYE87994.1 Restriction endonuclease, type II, AlwI [Fervidicella metallireducens AeB]SKA86924.1 Restriction endonuclease FokI, C terminal [Clostridium sp. USBA 49]HBW26490.1 restriction endonuclease [Acetivibrio thermocellus]
MLNYWWVTRPKRKLNSVPEVLSAFAELSLDQEWQGQRESHLSFEDALEQAGLKRKGERRDQTGGGARTYKAWLTSLGLIFTQESTGKIKLTLAGEAIMAGDSPVEVLKNQILKYQFPSSFSLSRGVQVAPRFKIRPFRFLLRLLNDPEIEYLTEEEIAKIIVTKAENETDKCYRYIVGKILEFRQSGDMIHEEDFFDKYKSSKGDINLEHPYRHLMDLANTIVNWLEYTQLVKRDNGEVRILEDKRLEVQQILSVSPPFIDRPEQHEYFQRKYGLDPKHKKDTRNLTETKTITAKIIAEQKIKKAYIVESLKQPITKITTDLIDKISEQTGFEDKLVEETLLKLYPRGSVGAFMTEYFEMAFKGRDEASDFEKATVQLFQNVFGFEAKHVGPIGLTPDVLILSDKDGYQAIIDNKAYSKYTISNDHHNRMVHNYIGNLNRYSNSSDPLAFFSYIAGGFGKNINSQIIDIVNATGVSGSAMSVSNMIKLVESYESKHYTHKNIRDIFSVNRQILLSDL